MASSDDAPRCIRLLEPVAKVGDVRLDALPSPSSHGLGKSHHMFMLLAATDIELEGHDWQDFCIPQRSGPRPMAHSDVVHKHRREVEELCRVAGLSLSPRSWKLLGDPLVDTRVLLHLVEELRSSVERRDPEKSLAIIGRLHEWAPRLTEAEVPEKWHLGILMGTVSQEVPPDVARQPALADGYLERALEVTGVHRLASAIRAAKCDLPRSVFELLLEARRIDDATRVLAWMAPSFTRQHGLERKLRERAAEAGRKLTEPTWVGISGGPSTTTIAAPNVSGVIGESTIAVGLGGTMDRDALARSAERVMDELLGTTGGQLRHIVIGSAGYERDNPRELLRALRAAAIRRDLRSDLWVANDGDLLVVGPPLLGSGVAVVADMGSVVVARRPGGEAIARRGGGEWLLSDSGSGFEIAVRAMREAYERVDACVFGARLDDDLLHLVVAACQTFGEPVPEGIGDAGGCRIAMERIGRYEAVQQHFEKSRIASFARPVLRLAAAGNGVARRVVESAARRLGQHMAEALLWHPDPQPRILVVGSLTSNEVYFDALRSGARSCLSAASLQLGEDRVEAKLAGLCRPASESAADARMDNPAVLFAEIGRMLDTRVTELSAAQSEVVDFLRDPRSRGIVTHIPSH